MNWLSALGCLDDSGTGSLPDSVFERALLAFRLKMSNSEVKMFVGALKRCPPPMEQLVPLSSFEDKLVEASRSVDVLQLERWFKLLLEPVSSNVAITLRGCDEQMTGSISHADFCKALLELVDSISDEQMTLLLHVAGKTESAEVDYMDFADAFGAPPPPPPPPDVSWPEEAQVPGTPEAPGIDDDTLNSFFTCSGTLG